MELKFAVDAVTGRTLPKMVADQYGFSEEKAQEVMSKAFYPTLARWQDYF